MNSKAKTLLKASAFCSILLSQSVFADEVTVHYNPVSVTYDGSLQVGRLKGFIDIQNTSLCHLSPHGIFDTYYGSKKVSYRYPADTTARNTAIQMYSSTTDTLQHYISCAADQTTIKTEEGQFEGDINYFRDLCLSLGGGFHPSVGGLMAQVELQGSFSSPTGLIETSITGIKPLTFDLNCVTTPPSSIGTSEKEIIKPKGK